VFNNNKNKSLEDNFYKCTKSVSESEVIDLVESLATKIASMVEDTNLSIRIISILKGGDFFSTFLIQKLKLKLPNTKIKKEGITVSLYDKETLTVSSNKINVELNGCLMRPQSDQELLFILDDLYDTGSTMNYVKKHLTNSSKIIYLTLFGFLGSLSVADQEQPLIMNKCMCLRLIPNSGDLWYVGCGLDLDEEHRDKPELRFVIKNHYLLNKKLYLNNYNK